MTSIHLSPNLITFSTGFICIYGQDLYFKMNAIYYDSWYMIVLLTIYIERMNNQMRFRAGDLDDRPRYIPVVQQRFTDRHNRWPYDHSRIYWYVRSITLSWFNHPSIQNSELEINKLLSKDGRFGYKLSFSLPITWYLDDPPFFF